MSSPASTNPKPLSFRANEKSAFDQKLEDSRFLVAYGLLEMTRRRLEVGSRGSNPSFLKKKGCRLGLHPFSGQKTELIFGLEVCREQRQSGIEYQHCVEAARGRFLCLQVVLVSSVVEVLQNRSACSDREVIQKVIVWSIVADTGGFDLPEEHPIGRGVCTRTKI